MLGKAQLTHTGSLTDHESMSEIIDIEVESAYKGPHVEFPLTLETTKTLIEHFKSKKVNQVLFSC